jgi:hypothetical protein
MRSILMAGLAAAISLAPAAATTASAQSFGLGGRLSMIRFDTNAETSAERFLGGQIRAHLSPRTAVELSLDVRTQRNETLTERVRDVPIQASLLLFPVDAPVAPYVLGGAGWYSHRVEALAGDDVLATETTREFGWHGGFGAELRMGRHAALHGDYRYTFLRFGDDEDAPEDEEGGGHWFLPSYRGSMWTAGLTVYF